jgi:hypothetical protein
MVVPFRPLVYYKKCAPILLGNSGFFFSFSRNFGSSNIIAYVTHGIFQNKSWECLVLDK